MRRSIVYFLAGTLLMAASACPAAAQFDDLVAEIERLQTAGEGQITLELRAAPVKEAVAKLAEAAKLEFLCEEALAEKKVTLIARERPVREVREGLALAVRGQWREDGDRLVLEPANGVQALKPAEVAMELRCALQMAGAASPTQVAFLERQVLSIFTPLQMETMAGQAGLAVANLSGQQQHQLAWLLRGRVIAPLVMLPRSLVQMEGARQTVVTMQKRGPFQWLSVQSPYWQTGMMLPANRPGGGMAR